MAIPLFLMFFSRALMLLLVMPVTRCARGIMAKWMGDDTAEREGKITLNPFTHLDPIGSVLILLIGFGWGKPMNVNPRNFKSYRKGVIMVSLAGPAANIIFALLCGAIYQILSCTVFVETTLTGSSILFILKSIFGLNVCLAVFHLLPIPPMDGFTILRFCAGGKFQQWYYMNQQKFRNISMIVLLVIFLLPAGINPFIYLISFVQKLLWKAVSWIPLVL